MFLWICPLSWYEPKWFRLEAEWTKEEKERIENAEKRIKIERETKHETSVSLNSSSFFVIRCKVALVASFRTRITVR